MPSHSMEGADIPCCLLTCTYRLVDTVREYSHALVVGPTALMSTLASDPAGRDLFDYWHHEDFGSGRPADIEDLFGIAWQDSPLFYDLQGSEALRLAEGHVPWSMTREYVQLSTFMALDDDYHGLRALLRNRDWSFAQHVCGWNTKPPVSLCNNTVTGPCLRSTTGMAIGTNVHHSAYLQSAYFLRA